MRNYDTAGCGMDRPNCAGDGGERAVILFRRIYRVLRADHQTSIVVTVSLEIA